VREPGPEPPRTARLQTPPRPRAPTPSTIALLAVLAAFFAVQLALSPRHDGEGPLLLYRMGSLHAPSVRAGDLWRIGSYAFLHIGFAHFLVNAWALWVLMRPLEATFGSAVSLGIFAATALAGGLASATHAELAGQVWLQAAGASGGIFGLFGATFALWFRLRHRLPRAAVRAAMRAMLINLLINAGIALIAPVDSWAHAGGFLAGILVALVAPLAMLPRRPWHAPVQWLIVGSTFVLAAMEGAAVARAVHPHDRTLTGRGATAQAPFHLVPVGPGEAVSVTGMQAVIFTSEAAPPAGKGRLIGGREFFEQEGGHEPPAVREVDLLAAEGQGSIGVRVVCELEGCKGLVDDVAEHIAASLKPAP
jgi:rhomboid protease GluP